MATGKGPVVRLGLDIEKVGSEIGFFFSVKVGGRQSIDFNKMIGRIKSIETIGLILGDAGKIYEVKIKIAGKVFQARQIL